MAICRVCGGPRTPIPGLPLKAHLMCLPDELVLWPEAEQRAWLAERAAQESADPPPELHEDATGDQIR